MNVKHVTADNPIELERHINQVLEDCPNMEKRLFDIKYFTSQLWTDRKTSNVGTDDGYYIRTEYCASIIFRRVGE